MLQQTPSCLHSTQSGGASVHFHYPHSAGTFDPACWYLAGDFVDRGAWGVETLALLLAWKWLLPSNVYLIRGNHEVGDELLSRL
jgi:hypothetical protein